MALTTTCGKTPPDGILSGTAALTDAAATASAMRRCLATGEVRPKHDLIRFVLDPQHKVVPDLAGKLPGRGLWVGASREALEAAIRKNLFSRAAKTNAIINPDLVQQVERLLAKRCLDLLGLARGAGLVVTGQPQVEEAQKAGELAYVLMASDAGQDVRKKLHRAMIVECAFTRAQLGEALGREQLAAPGLKPHDLSEKLGTELKRLKGVKSEPLLASDCE